LVRGKHIQLQGRPAVLARGVEAFIKLDSGGARVRLAPRASPELDQRIRFFGTSGENAARAVIFERAADQADAIGEKRRGERVALLAGERPAIETEAKPVCAVDQTAFGKTMWLGGRHA